MSIFIGQRVRSAERASNAGVDAGVTCAFVSSRSELDDMTRSRRLSGAVRDTLIRSGVM